MKTRDPGAPQSDAPLRQKRSKGACRHSGISGAEMDTTRGGRGPTNTETPYPRSLKSYLLEAAGTRPCGRRAAEQRDEVAPFHHRGHSMTGKQARTAETRRRAHEKDDRHAAARPIERFRHQPGCEGARFAMARGRGAHPRVEGACSASRIDNCPTPMSPVRHLRGKAAITITAIILTVASVVLRDLRHEDSRSWRSAV